MRLFASFALCSMLIISAPATAAETGAAVSVKRGDAIFSSDGSRIGRVVSTIKDKDGTVSSVSVIYRGRSLRIPASSLTAGEKRLTSSLTLSEITR